MRRLTVIILLCSLLIAMSAYPTPITAAETNANSQIITRVGSQPSEKASEQYFTGNVRVDRLFSANASAQFTGAYVTFEPGARSNWHIHPAGQRLLVTSGVGLTQEWGGPIVEIYPGDVVWCPPGIKHWHGASPTTAMTHLAFSSVLNGKTAEWLEKVSDEQYYGK